MLEINHKCVFTAADATAQLATIHNQGVEDDILITFALKTKLKASDICKQINESGLFATNTKWDENEDITEDEDFMECAAHCTAHLKQLHAHIEHHLCLTEDNMEITVATLDIQLLRAISKLQHPESSFDTDSLPNELLEFMIDSIQLRLKNKLLDSCRPDIGYAITLLSKFGSCPSAYYHYSCLKNVAQCFQATKDWGIQFCRPRRNNDSKLAKSNQPEVQQQADKLPSYPEPITN